MNPIEGRIYKITRDQWKKIRCNVEEGLPGPPRQLNSLGVYGSREAGFELGNHSPQALELALAILVDHAALPPENTAWVFTHGFVTSDVRVLDVWMKHGRLRDQRLINPTNPNVPVSVSEQELQRLMRSGFLSSTLKAQHDKAVEVSEKAMERLIDDSGHVRYKQRVRPGASRKPMNEARA